MAKLGKLESQAAYRVGQKVKLRVEVAHFPKGSVGRVSSVQKRDLQDVPTLTVELQTGDSLRRVDPHQIEPAN